MYKIPYDFRNWKNFQFRSIFHDINLYEYPSHKMALNNLFASYNQDSILSTCNRNIQQKNLRFIVWCNHWISWISLKNISTSQVIYEAFDLDEKCENYRIARAFEIKRASRKMSEQSKTLMYIYDCVGMRFNLPLTLFS